MSFWAACVITNFFSAIPYLGPDLVEFIYINILLNTLFLYIILRVLVYIFHLRLGYFLHISFTSVFFLFYLSTSHFSLRGTYASLPIYTASLFRLRGYKTSPLVFSLDDKILPTVGLVSPHAIKKGNKIILPVDKSKFLSIPYSFLSLFVGLIDGDGYILVHQTSKGFIKINLTLSLNIRDLSVLQYIYSILNFGNINVYPKKGKPDTCKLVINRTDLQQILFPLLIHHKLFFLNDRRIKQFDTAMYIFIHNIKQFNEIPSNIKTFFPLPDTSESYSKLPFFQNWIVGFTIAEGSFLFKSNGDACFQLRQRKHLLLFEALKLQFGTNRSITTEKNLYHLLSLSSKEDIQQVINFFSFSGLHPLLGHQLIRYQNWLSQLKMSHRYSNLKFSL